MSLRREIDQISRTSTGLARWCLDHDLPAMAAYCLQATQDSIPPLNTSGAALAVEAAGITVEQMRDQEQRMLPWYRDHQQQWSERETARREALVFAPDRLQWLSRPELAALLPFNTPLLPLSDILLQDEWYALPLLADLQHAAAALAYHAPGIPEQRDCDNYTRVLWGEFARCTPGNLAVAYANITHDQGGHAVAPALTADAGLVFIENAGDVYPVDVAYRCYGQRSGVQIVGMMM